MKKKKEISSAKDLTRGPTGGPDGGNDSGSADRGDFVNRVSTTAEFAEKSESGTAGTALPASGRDGYPENASAVTYLDKEFDDFDAQSEQLDNYNQEYTKISTDRFYGRFASAHLDGGVSVHYETVNCAMHQHVGCLEGLIGFGVSLGQPGVAANGVKLDHNDVFITRPGSELEVDVPSEGATFLLVAVDLAALESLACTDSGLEYLDPDRREASVVRAAGTANAISAGGGTILQACARAPGTWRPQGAAGAAVAEIVAALELDVGLGIARERTSGKHSAALFTAARDAFSAMREFDYAKLSAATGASPRTIQMAFAEHAGTPPINYFRAVRLHRVRNALLAGAGAGPKTIGDIAAAHGFQSWSRFSQLYRRQFGETPSETRARMNGGPGSPGAA